MISGRFLLILRGCCAVILLLTTVLFVLAVPARYSQLNQIAPEMDLGSGTLGPQEASALETLGISLAGFAGYITTVESLTALIGILVGAIIFLRRGNDWMALFVSIALTTMGTFPTPLMTSISEVQPFWASVLSVLQSIAIGPGFLIFYLFPDGHFVPSWTRWFWLTWLFYAVSWLVFPTLKPPNTLFAVSSMPPLILVVIMIPILVGVLAQIFRYRFYASQTQRQQTKWVVFGFSVTLLILVVVASSVRWVGLDTRTPMGMLALLVGISLVVIALSIAPITVMVSILQYRLWDIDLIIRRTLVYGALTATLAFVYFASVILMQSFFRILTGQGQSPIVTVISTLAIAALFTPLRRRIQNDIDRRFYRRKYDAEKALEAFALTVRQQVDLDEISESLLSVVQETMQPEGVSLWLQKSPLTLRPGHRAASAVEGDLNVSET